MLECPGRTWPIHVKPRPAETPESYVARLAAANAISKVALSAVVRNLAESHEVDEESWVRTAQLHGGLERGWFERDALRHRPAHPDGTTCDKCDVGMGPRYDCTLCTKGATVELLATLRAPVCLRHRRWIGSGAFPDQQRTVDENTVRAAIKYRRLVRRGRLDAVLHYVLRAALRRATATTHNYSAVEADIVTFSVLVEAAALLSDRTFLSELSDARTDYTRRASLLKRQLAPIPADVRNYIIQGFGWAVRPFLHQLSDGTFVAGPHTYGLLTGPDTPHPKVDGTWLDALNAVLGADDAVLAPHSDRVIPAHEGEFAWHPTRNGSLSIDDLSEFSHQRVWWVCANGHEVKQSRALRSRNGCHYCAGQRPISGWNSLDVVRPDLAAVWDSARNTVPVPDHIKPMSNQKVWFLCRNGHPVRTAPAVREGSACVYCAGKLVWQGFNDLASQRPDIAAEWHPTMNRPLLPSEVTVGSATRVFWLCAKGHTYDSPVGPRTSGKKSGCPYCAGRKPWAGHTDLASQRPDIAAEWHPTMNGSLRPCDVTVGSGRRVFWLCPDEGHHYLAGIVHRTRGAFATRCPYCAGKKVWVGYNDLASQRSDLAAEWHPTMNGDLQPSDVTLGSGKKVYWLCPRGHTFYATIGKRTTGTGCPYCSGKLHVVGVNDLATRRDDIAAQLHPTMNGTLRALDLSVGSSRKVWWICQEKHHYLAKVSSRTKPNNPTGCPYCANRKVWRGYNDLAFRRPDIAAEFHPTKNAPLEPCDVVVGSHKKVYWVCEKGHEYRASVVKRTQEKNPTGCPVCAGRQVLQGYNDLASQAPHAAGRWHPTLNGDLSPTEVTVRSHKQVWWLCDMGHTYLERVDRLTRAPSVSSTCRDCVSLARPMPTTPREG
ncbi:MAG: hypothetical protein EOL89_02370 [Actinobacteria bacterium]|nr:hypothetical protein [Actinomycetota bacterium]